jgi:hypothetical protein
MCSSERDSVTIRPRPLRENQTDTYAALQCESSGIVEDVSTM